jgi:hypothetical protein
MCSLAACHSQRNNVEHIALQKGKLVLFFEVSVISSNRRHPVTLKEF